MLLVITFRLVTIFRHSNVYKANIVLYSFFPIKNTKDLLTKNQVNALQNNPDEFLSSVDAFRLNYLFLPKCVSEQTYTPTSLSPSQTPLWSCITQKLNQIACSHSTSSIEAVNKTGPWNRTRNYCVYVSQRQIVFSISLWGYVFCKQMPRWWVLLWLFLR